jgi:hypothetical protein
LGEENGGMLRKSGEWSWSGRSKRIKKVKERW